MKAADVMVTNVISVGSQASVQEVAEVLLRNRISGVPVIGPQGELVGIVSEGDLMRRPEAGTERRHSWWLALLTSSEGMASDYIKSHSRKVVGRDDAKGGHGNAGYPGRRNRNAARKARHQAGSDRHGREGRRDRQPCQSAAGAGEPQEHAAGHDRRCEHPRQD